MDLISAGVEIIYFWKESGRVGWRSCPRMEPLIVGSDWTREDNTRVRRQRGK